MNFKVGDKVVVIRDDEITGVGSFGTVILVSEFRVTIDFDKINYAKRPSFNENRRQYPCYKTDLLVGELPEILRIIWGINETR